MRWVLAVLLAVAGSVAADDVTAFADDVTVVTIEAGKQARLWVGNANGWFCDIPSLVKASIVTEDEVNYWVVEGRQAGRTHCRVGTDPTRAVFVFDVTVTKPPAKARR